MSIDRFTPRALTAAVRLLGDGRVNFLVNSIFRRGQIHPTDIIDFGVMRIPARVAVYSRPGERAVAVNKNAGDSKTVKAPKIRLKKVFDENFAGTLNPALSTYVGPYTAPADQLAEKVSIEQAELRRRIDRTIEVQCAEALSSGTITLLGEDGVAIATAISMGYTGDGSSADDSYTIQPTLTGTSLWTSASSKPWENLNTWASQIRDHSDYDGALAVLMGVDAWNAFYAHDKILKYLDTRRVEAGGLTPVAAALFQGTFQGMQLYQYANGYENSAGTRVQAFNSKKIVIVPVTSDVLTIEHGAVFDKPTPDAQQATFLQTDYFSKLASHEDPPVDELIVESRPLALIKNPRAVRVVQVVA